MLDSPGEPRGISNSHNFIEADSSPTRDDIYVTGDPVTMNLKTFELLYDMVPENSGHTFTLEVMADFAYRRWNDSIWTNPVFYYGPISGTIARNTGFCFIANLMANHTSENPEGVLSKLIECIPVKSLTDVTQLMKSSRAFSE
jgi:hypothetical protein